MRWHDFKPWEKVAIVALVLWWVFGAWGASALGFRDPMFIVGLPFIVGFVFMALLEGFIWLLRRR